MEVLARLLGPAPDQEPARLATMRRLRARRERRRRAARPEPEPDVVAMFELIAAGQSEARALSPDIARVLGNPALAAVRRESLPAVFQAYVRAIGRIVSAEAELARQLMADTPVVAQAHTLEAAIRELLPVASSGFDLIHRILLLDALADSLSDDVLRGDETMGIAMVDLVGSTAYLRDHGVAELETLVDALFHAGQAATAHRAAHVVKYVGDGLFLASHDLPALSAAALEVLDRLEADLPLKARGGLSWGPVVSRAGDVFGMAVNEAHIVSKSARPGMLLATAVAAGRLPQEARGRYRTVELTHSAMGPARVATVRRPAPPAAGSPPGPPAAAPSA